MMKSVTIGLGAMTAAAVMAAAVPSGQAMLGVRAPADVAAVSVIRDTPPPAAPQPAQARAQVAPPAPVAAHVAVASRSADPRPVRAAPRSAVPAPASPPAGQPGIGEGLGSIASIATVLLNLPQEVSQASARHEEPQAAPSESPPPWTPRWSGSGRHGDSDHVPGESR